MTTLEQLNQSEKELTAQQEEIARQKQAIADAEAMEALREKSAYSTGEKSIHPSLNERPRPNFDEDEAKRESIAIAHLMAPGHQGGQSMSQSQAERYYRGLNTWDRVTALREGQRFIQNYRGK